MNLQDYLDHEIYTIKGMSGGFALEVVSGTMMIQSEAGIHGGVLEIGVFEGRFLIGLALALLENEQAIGVDTFNWPDAGVLSRAIKNIHRFEVADLVQLRRLDTGKALPKDLYTPDRQRPRVVHIDADHTHEALERDLLLAFEVVDQRGVIVIDDMLHPGYPELYDAVRSAQIRYPNWVVFCIIDRQNIVSSAKFMLADVHMLEFYTRQLKCRFPHYIWPLGAYFRHFRALVLAESPILAVVQ